MKGKRLMNDDNKRKMLIIEVFAVSRPWWLLDKGVQKCTHSVIWSVVLKTIRLNRKVVLCIEHKVCVSFLSVTFVWELCLGICAEIHVGLHVKWLSFFDLNESWCDVRVLHKILKYKKNLVTICPAGSEVYLIVQIDGLSELNSVLQGCECTKSHTDKLQTR
jgi:hypothetical protein